MYNPFDHYWDNGTNVFSSARLARFAYTDAAYQTWCAKGNVATADPGLTQLRAVLAPYGIGKRLLLDIVTDLNALSAPQKSNINAAWFTGTRPYLWEMDFGPNAAGIVAIVASAGSIAALTTAPKLGIAALYVQDNPSALAAPEFDPTINVLGTSF